jgi:hypothetical protein
MAALGRKGGRRGGPARARALAPARRTAIARKAARVRWSRPVVDEHASLDLASLVAHFGSSVADVRPPRRLEEAVVGAVEASRRDAALARMLPVFLWRTRHRLDLPALVGHAQRRRVGAALGFFLEAAACLGGRPVFDHALGPLRAASGGGRPSYFFRGTEKRPFERAAADRATPPLARRWGWLMNMPWDSFAGYFAKVAKL